MADSSRELSVTFVSILPGSVLMKEHFAVLISLQGFFNCSAAVSEA